MQEFDERELIEVKPTVGQCRVVREHCLEKREWVHRFHQQRNVMLAQHLELYSSRFTWKMLGGMGGLLKIWRLTMSQAEGGPENSVDHTINIVVISSLYYHSDENFLLSRYLFVQEVSQHEFYLRFGCNCVVFSLFNWIRPASPAVSEAVSRRLISVKGLPLN